MKTEKIIIANLKCNGCANTIKKELLKLEGVKSIEVDIENSTVNLSYENLERGIIINRLLSLGYPEATETNGFLLQVKSYTSCVVGKINNL